MNEAGKGTGGRGLRHGYTTGACATAAARGAALMLRCQRIVDEVEIGLPNGEPARFVLHGQRLFDDGASCYVVKDAGDDPDVTNGVQVHVTIRVAFFAGSRIVIEGGEGVGRVTKPGLAVPVGEWAINPVPRRMMLETVREVFAMRCIPAVFTVTVSIPDGAERAKKTLNERLGIIGGLSILGTTGIVKPVSSRAWTDTIDTAIDVALACGSDPVVLSTGRTSELVAQKRLGGEKGRSGKAGLSEEAFVMMGDHVGYALRAARKKGVGRAVLAGQFAKLLKIACGHEQTHVSSSQLDLEALAGLTTKSLPRVAALCRGANTARQVLEASGNDPALIALVCGKAREAAERIAPGLSLQVLLAGYGGDVLYYD